MITTHLPIDALDLSSLPRNHKTRLQLEVAADLPGPLALTALLATGPVPGPTLLAVAGVHGDEYEGMEAIRQVFAALDPERMAGTFLGLPVANPLAYAARSRATPAAVDGLNLARVFPGQPDGTLSHRLAHHLLAVVARNVGPDDLFIDLHSGSADIAFAPMIGWRDLSGPVTAWVEEAARTFGIPRLWRIPMSPGPFNAETSRRGIPTLGTETTGRAGCLAEDVASYVRGLRGLLGYLGIMTPTDRASRYDGPARATIDLIAPAGGFLRSSVRLLDEVEAGAALGQIVDIAGDEIDRVVTPVGGTIWAWRATPALRPGDLVGMIALAPDGAGSRYRSATATRDEATITR